MCRFFAQAYPYLVLLGFLCGEYGKIYHGYESEHYEELDVRKYAHAAQQGRLFVIQELGDAWRNVYFDGTASVAHGTQTLFEEAHIAFGGGVGLVREVEVAEVEDIAGAVGKQYGYGGEFAGGAGPYFHTLFFLYFEIGY